jgi:acyl carrier protein
LTITIDQIEQKVKKTIADKLSIDFKHIRNDMDLRKDLGADSLAILELIMSLEEHFDMNISDKDFDGVNTVQQSIEVIERLAA